MDATIQCAVVVLVVVEASCMCYFQLESFERATNNVSWWNNFAGRWLAYSNWEPDLTTANPTPPIR